MSWKKNEGTKHTCGGPKFGKLTDGCPRCEELKNGAEVRSWGSKHHYNKTLHTHNCKESNCGPVCTFGEW